MRILNTLSAYRRGLPIVASIESDVKSYFEKEILGAVLENSEPQY
jgi:hypothetical protein